MYQPNKRSREQTTLPYFKKKKKKTWKEKLETSVRQVNLQNEESVDNKGLRPRHKADQISNNTLNFPLCDPSPLLPPFPLIQTFRLIKAAQVCLALFQPNVSNFRSLLHYSFSSLSLHLLVVFLPPLLPRFNYFNESGN